MKALEFQFTDTYPPRPRPGKVGVYTGDARGGSTQRLIYNHRGIHVTVKEARGRFTLTGRWQWDGLSWTRTVTSIDDKGTAIRKARDLIELLRSIRQAFGDGRETDVIELVKKDVEGALTTIEEAARRLRMRLP